MDIGIAHPVEEGGLLRRHVTRGTRSIAKGPAMTRDEAVAAVVTGITRWQRSSRAGDIACWRQGRWASATPPPPPP